MTERIPVLQPGDRLPDFSLPSTAGRPIRISNFRNRMNLVVLFVAPGSMDLLQSLLIDLNQAEHELIEHNTQVLVVLPVNVDEAEQLADKYSLNYPILADAGGTITLDTVHVHQPGIELYILDQYGEIYAVERIETGGHIPEMKEVLDWVRFIEIQCPE